MPIPTGSSTEARTSEQRTTEWANTNPTASNGAGADTGAGTSRQKTEAEREADWLYEERMEEEYAKREGGA